MPRPNSSTIERLPGHDHRHSHSRRLPGRCLNQLYLAWQIAIQALEDHEQLSDTIDIDDGESAAQEYWRKSQPALANALGVAQQAMEMALKGRIAAVSPYLLISRDPKEWPKGVDVQSVAFSEFRTLDATDLIKVHNILVDHHAPLMQDV